MFSSSLRRATGPTRCLVLATLAMLSCASPPVLRAQEFKTDSIVHEIRSAKERLEMIANTSRILTLGTKIPQVQVNNPELLTAKPLSPHEIQIAALEPGVTQVNLWDEEGNIHTIDVIIYGDSRELELLLRSQFPEASLQVHQLSNSILINGYIDNPDQVSRIVQIAEEFSPKVINLIKVGGVQQVLLKVKVMEISRTKLRQLSHDFAHFEPDMFLTSGVSGLLGSVVSNAGAITSTGGETISYGILGDNSSFFGLMNALRQNDMMKILAEPDLVTISGRPASFNVGGEFPILVPQSLGTVSIMFKKFGTQLDFVPLVLGGGRIRLEVRPRVSEIDETRSVRINDIDVPGLRVREVNTGVEMRAGQTLALAGLIQNRIDAQTRGVPFLGELPWIGAAFRSVREVNNEIELLILVTPYLVDALDPEEVPQGGPGLSTCSPTDLELYFRGHLEVPCCSDSRCDRCQSKGAWSGTQGMILNEIQSTPVETPTSIESRIELQVNPASSTHKASSGVKHRAVRPVSRGILNSKRKHVSSSKGVRRNTVSEGPVLEPARPIKRQGKNASGAASRRKRRPQPSIFGPVGYDLKN